MKYNVGVCNLQKSFLFYLNMVQALKQRQYLSLNYQAFEEVIGLMETY